MERGEVDGRSDLYALTCTYYFLLTGRLAFDAPSLPALGYQHRYEPFPDPRQHVPNLPDGICRILTRGSAKEPSERFQNAEELVSELEVLLACPNESLTFGSSWRSWRRPAGSDPSPLDDPLSRRIRGITDSHAAPGQTDTFAASCGPSSICRSGSGLPLGESPRCCCCWA